ncbi:hypothetical protein IW261DRAFT_1572622 [Armillaria novae-zelandiae]|uniref:Uncharacterized protein n=1 Tax=Armillaria novae-zelandiae TaxID=153914 RepID=A0AA39U9W5_9AGAR|nr:hypothetical protein IW261DRAFT_1572622 [Armillaria novae-zelandiae]
MLRGRADSMGAVSTPWASGVAFLRLAIRDLASAQNAGKLRCLKLSQKLSTIPFVFVPGEYGDAMTWTVRGSEHACVAGEIPPIAPIRTSTVKEVNPMHLVAESWHRPPSIIDKQSFTLPAIHLVD